MGAHRASLMSRPDAAGEKGSGKCGFWRAQIAGDLDPSVCILNVYWVGKLSELLTLNSSNLEFTGRFFSFSQLFLFEDQKGSSHTLAAAKPPTSRAVLLCWESKGCSSLLPPHLCAHHPQSQASVHEHQGVNPEQQETKLYCHIYPCLDLYLCL